MALFLVVPILMIVYVSFWTQTTFKIEPTLTLASWKQFFGIRNLPQLADHHGQALADRAGRDLRASAIPPRCTSASSSRARRCQTVLLVICVIPFWTSFLIRVLAWRPMLGKEGAINIILQKFGLISARHRSPVVQRTLGA